MPGKVTVGLHTLAMHHIHEWFIKLMTNGVLREMPIQPVFRQGFVILRLVTGNVSLNTQ